MYQRIMDELKKQIIYLNELTNKSRNLKKIEQVELGVASAKGIFKHLVKYPEAITHFSDFYIIRYQRFYEHQNGF